MNRKSLIFLIIFILLVISASHAAYYYPQYWIFGSIADKDNIGTKDRQVVFYETVDLIQKGVYVYDAASAGSYILNAFGASPAIEPFVIVGNSYNVYIPNDNANPDEGYGADSVAVKILGSGVDLANLELKKGGAKDLPGLGSLPPVGGVLGDPPVVDWIKFGDRIYQKTLVDKGEKFIVSATPKITAKISSTLAIKTDKVTIKINEAGGPTSSYTHTISENEISNKELSAKDVKPKETTGMTITFKVPDLNKLGEGANTIALFASNSAGGTSEAAYVTVMSGPVQIIGTVLTYPSPFSPTKNKEVLIQYTLSTDADIDVYVFSPTGDIIKKFINTKGQNGGAAGVNKITWNGQKPGGSTAGNAVYSGAVVSHTEGKVLAKFKLTIVD